MKSGVFNKSVIAIIFVIFIVLVFFGNKTLKRQSVTVDTMLDTVSEITVISAKDETHILDGCVEIIRKYDKMFSPSGKDSDVYKIGTNDVCEVSAETVELIDRCREFYYETEKKFDITVGAVSSLWDDAIKKEQVPDENELEYAGKFTDFENLYAEKTTVTKKESQQKITFGAVAKGYIADKIREYLLENKIYDAMVNLGGNIYVSGKKENGKSWKVGIQDPRDENSLLGAVEISDKFIVSSGDYQRYTEIDNERYHHIIDATDGYPAKSGVIATTVISDNGFLADALSTTCFLVGYEKGRELSKKYNALTIFVTDDKKVYYPEEIKDIFDISNQGYEFISYK